MLFGTFPTSTVYIYTTKVAVLHWQNLRCNSNKNQIENHTSFKPIAGIESAFFFFNFILNAHVFLVVFDVECGVVDEI